MPSISDDSDLAHLFELLRMLPGPADNSAFWEEVAAQVNHGTSVGYLFQKLVNIWRAYNEPTPGNVEYLARYLLFFFAGDNSELWKALNTVARDTVTMTGDDVGRWWAQDVTRTAWSLYVRYNQGVNDHWPLKWKALDD
jgi:hypothetical protein